VAGVELSRMFIARVLLTLNGLEILVSVSWPLTSQTSADPAVRILPKNGATKMKTEIKDIRSGISATCAEEFLNSAANSENGQSQYSTPLDLAKTIAALLPPAREVIVDLTAGNGQLLGGIADDSTGHVLAVEIQRMNNVKLDRAAYNPLHWSRITGDLTLVYELLCQASFSADLFALNPPYNLHWYRDRLTSLANSDLPAVREAYAAHDPNLKDTLIDSTVATMLIALDRMTVRGEGVIIANNTTVERLIFAENAPFEAMASHVWARFILDGNPMTDEKGSRWEADYKTAIIYFAASHNVGCSHTVPCLANLTQLRTAITRTTRHHIRVGLGMMFNSQGNSDAVDVFEAVKDEWRQRNRKDGVNRDDYNLWLDTDGFVQTQLSRFDLLNAKVDKKQAAALHELKGRRPMELVMQVATRNALRAAVEGTMWRVAPSLPEAVKDAIGEYDSVRAPLSPLTAVQALGYADEERWLTCTKDFYG
jgi:predicted RNA methylase